MQLAPRPIRMNIEDVTRLDPIGFEDELPEAPMINPTPVASVARMFSFGIL